MLLVRKCGFLRNIIRQSYTGEVRTVCEANERSDTLQSSMHSVLIGRRQQMANTCLIYEKIPGLKSAEIYAHLWFGDCVRMGNNRAVPGGIV